MPVFIFWLIAIIGSIANICQVISYALSDLPVTAMFVIKAVGIFAFPLGSFLGYVGMF